jgi:DNA invertase Pin-like site-specific DNA recombinase
MENHPMSTPSQTTRVAIYSRVSTDKQDTQNQLSQLRLEAAAKPDWTVRFEFVDTCTGGTSEREQFQLMFEAAERHEFDLLLFWSLDRLTREGTLETLQHLRRLEKAGVGFRSLTEPYLDSAGIMKDVVMALLATQAKQEKIRISERTRAGLHTARLRGARLGRPESAVDTQKLVELRSRGLSVRAIARQLNIPKSTIQNRLQVAA